MRFPFRLISSNEPCPFWSFYFLTVSSPILQSMPEIKTHPYLSFDTLHFHIGKTACSPVCNKSTDIWFMRRRTSSFEVISGQSNSKTRRRQLLVKVWNFCCQPLWQQIQPLTTKMTSTDRQQFNFVVLHKTVKTEPVIFKFRIVCVSFKM